MQPQLIIRSPYAAPFDLRLYLPSSYPHPNPYPYP